MRIVSNHFQVRPVFIASLQNKPINQRQLESPPAQVRMGGQTTPSLVEKAFVVPSGRLTIGRLGNITVLASPQVKDFHAVFTRVEWPGGGTELQVEGFQGTILKGKGYLMEPETLLPGYIFGLSEVGPHFRVGDNLEIIPLQPETIFIPEELLYQPLPALKNTLKIPPINALNDFKERPKLPKGEAYQQTRQFQTEHKITAKEKILDGFWDVGSAQKPPDGKNSPNQIRTQEAVAVDRARDPVLKALIAAVKQGPSKWTSRRQKEQLIRQLVWQVFAAGGLPYLKRQALIENLYPKTYYLGEIAKQRMGIGRHAALLYKILADEAGLKVDLVRGLYPINNHHGQMVHGEGVWNVFYPGWGRFPILVSPAEGFAFPLQYPIAQQMFVDLNGKPLYTPPKWYRNPWAWNNYRKTQ